MSILNEEGLSELTMRRLATELGIASGSLYGHVARREGLLVEVGDKVLGEFRSQVRSYPGARPSESSLECSSLDLVGRPERSHRKASNRRRIQGVIATQLS